MSRLAWAYIVVVVLLGAVLCGVALMLPAPSSQQWITFATFLVFATCAQLYKALGPTHDAYHINLVFLFAGCLVLPPLPYVLLVIIPHTVEWIRERTRNSSSLRAWYIQPFNMAVHIIAGLAAQWMFVGITSPGKGFGTLSAVAAGLMAAVAYVFLNHVLVGEAIHLARKKSWRESGILNISNIITNLVLILLGFIVAVVWTINPWLIVPALSPLLLMYRALNIPRLTREAHTDAKTGLWNAQHFMTLYTSELERAKRYNRPLSVIMADLDLLRNINNTYGHVAGDAVLIGVARLLQENIRGYDVAGRFGGEEFCVALPETSSSQALVVAERLRTAVEAASFAATTLTHPIHATLSVGLASFPSDAEAPTELIHKADVAVYSAKLNGRNCVVIAADVAESIEAAMPGADAGAVSDRLQPFVPRPVMAANANAPAETRPITAPAEAAEETVTAMPKRDVIYCAYVDVVLIAAALASAAGLAMNRTIDAPLLVLLALVTAATRMPRLKSLYGQYAAPLSVAITFAAAIIAGVAGVTVVASVFFLDDLRSGRVWIGDALLHWAVQVLAGLPPAIAAAVVSKPLHGETLYLHVIVMVLAAFAYYAIERGLMAVAARLSDGQSALQVWRQWLPVWGTRYLTLCFVGYMLAVVYSVLGSPGLVVWIVAIVGAAYAQRRGIDYAGRLNESHSSTK